MKTKWLNNIKNGTGKDSQHWLGDHRDKLPPSPEKVALIKWCKAAGLLGK